MIYHTLPLLGLYELLADSLPFSEESSTDTNVLIQDVDLCGFTNVYLSSDIVTELVLFEYISFVLRNDLAGDKVVVRPLVIDKPCLDQSIEPNESGISNSNLFV